MRHTPYITFSGAAFNSNKTDSEFDVNAPQYTSFYKSQRHLSTFPVRAHFDDTRYKNKKPLPSNNTYVAVEGFLWRVELDSNSGLPSLFHVAVDSISFLGKAVLPLGGHTNQGAYLSTSHVPCIKSIIRFSFNSTLIKIQIQFQCQPQQFTTNQSFTCRS